MNASLIGMVKGNGMVIVVANVVMWATKMKHKEDKHVEYLLYPFDVIIVY